MSNPTSSPPAPRRWRLPLILAAVVVIGLGAAGYYFYSTRNTVSTDDAYVNGNLVRLTPQQSGTVVAINCDQTQFVSQGQLLIQLDPHDSDVALAQSEASLGETVREVAQLFANANRDEASVAAQQTTLDRANKDLARDQSLAGIGGVSQEDLQHDRDAVRAATAALGQARAALAASQAAIVGTDARNHPRVLQAEAALRSAWLASARTRVLAPVSGYVVRRSVQLGQQISQSTELLAIVPLESTWIDANFKENQLADLRVGQPVAVSADMYGSRADYHGKILGLTAGTGSALAVLPAQNASGNWIKIVQRLPVRIGLDPQELRLHPLFLGLSTRIDVDVSDRNGPTISEKPSWPAAQSTGAYAAQEAGVDRAMQEIVERNLGREGGATPAARKAL